MMIDKELKHKWETIDDTRPKGLNISLIRNKMYKYKNMIDKYDKVKNFSITMFLLSIVGILMLSIFTPINFIMFWISVVIYYIAIVVAIVTCAVEKDNMTNVETKKDLLICFLPFGFAFVQAKKLFNDLD